MSEVSKAKRTTDIMARTSLIEDESLSFNSADMQMDGYSLMGDSPPYPDDPAADLIPPDPRNRSNFEAIPMDLDPPMMVKSSFDAIPMEEQPPRANKPAPKPSGGGSRLLMKRTIDKAADTAPGTTDPSMLVPQEHERPTVQIQLNHEPERIIFENDTGIASTPASSFALFTKLPPVGAKPADMTLPFPMADKPANPYAFDIKAEPQRPIIKNASQAKGFTRVSLETKPFIPNEEAPFIPTEPRDPAPFIPTEPRYPAPFIPTGLGDPPPLVQKPFIPNEEAPFIPSQPRDPAPFIPAGRVDPVPLTQKPYIASPDPPTQLFIPTSLTQKPFIPAQEQFMKIEARETQKPFIPSPDPPAQPFIPAQVRDPAPLTQKPFIPSPDPPAQPFIPAQVRDPASLTQKPFIPAQEQFMEIEARETQKPFIPESTAHLVTQEETPPTQFIPERVLPGSSVERAFTATLDRSIASLKRMFSAEFSSIMRNRVPQSTHSVDFDEFSDSLMTEISQIIDNPVAPVELNTQQFSKRIIAAIDEHTKPVMTSLVETELRNSTVTSTYVTELKQLHKQVEALRTGFKGKVDKVMRELECEREVSAAMHDMENKSVRDLENRMRTVKLKKAEIETKLKHQKRERENIERLAKQNGDHKYAWEDESSFSESESLRHRLIQELSALIRTIDEDEHTDIAKSLETAVRIVKDEEASMRNDMQNLEWAARFASMKKQNLRNSKAARMKVPKSSVIAEAEKRVKQVRSQRGMR